MINHGTGIIIGEQRIDGRCEYILLTNAHVANNYHVNGESTLSIVEGDGVRAPIRLVTLAVDHKRDQALLRTDGCGEKLTIAELVIGPPPGGSQGDRAFTEGYGNGTFNAIECAIVSTRSKSWGLRCYRIDVSVGAGQSGAPLIIIGEDKRLYLPALVFCGDEHSTEATPLYPGRGVLRQFATPSNKRHGEGEL
jgi:S1-C subfamily serine protease